MTIAEQLRRAASLGLINGGLMEEAAVEIERLEGHIYASNRCSLEDCKRKADEIERLRKVEAELHRLESEIRRIMQ